IISYYILRNQRKSKIIFEIILNSMCYITIYSIFLWDKIYYIFKKEGNNVFKYFICIRHETCSIHHSTTCECSLLMTKEELLINAKKTINVYNVCRKTFVIINKRLAYVSPKIKLKYLKFNEEI
ncbi:hypothetical protein BCR36DRAFT_311543, partial [Piromyces finnis]